MKFKALFVFTFFIAEVIFAQNFKKKPAINDQNIIKSEVNFVNSTRIDDLLEKQKRINTNTVSVYRVQIYSGHRNGSKEAQERFNEIFPEFKAETSYEQPYFKTKVNAFRTRLEAEKTLKRYKRYFKDAFIFEEIISIDKL